MTTATPWIDSRSGLLVLDELLSIADLRAAIDIATTNPGEGLSPVSDTKCVAIEAGGRMHPLRKVSVSSWRGSVVLVLSDGGEPGEG